MKTPAAVIVYSPRRSARHFFLEMVIYAPESRNYIRKFFFKFFGFSSVVHCCFACCSLLYSICSVRDEKLELVFCKTRSSSSIKKVEEAIERRALFYNIFSLCLSGGDSTLRAFEIDYHSIQTYTCWSDRRLYFNPTKQNENIKYLFFRQKCVNRY